MLSLSKKVDYALIALAYLAERPGRTASAREIAAARDLPAPLLMNLLKELHRHRILQSTRGTLGGYQIAIDPGSLSLHDLIELLEGPIRMISCATDICGHETEEEADECRVSGQCAVQAPLEALHHRLVRFLQEVKLSDVILPDCPGVAHVSDPAERIGSRMSDD